MADTNRMRGTLDVAGLVGPLWCVGWLFTIGFAHLPLVQAVLALVLWPYYLGVTLG